MNDKNGVIWIDQVDNLNNSITLAASDHEPFSFSVLLRIRPSCVANHALSFRGGNPMLFDFVNIPFDPAKVERHKVYYIRNSSQIANYLQFL